VENFDWRVMRGKEALVNKVIVGFSLGLFIACAPELRARPGERCDESESCGEGLTCYRGFCIADESAPVVPGAPEVVVEGEAGAAPGAQSNGPQVSTTSDAGVGTTSSGLSGAASDGGTRSAGSAVNDAGTSREAASEAQTSGDKPASSPAVTSEPATASDAATPAATGNGASGGQSGAKPNPAPPVTTTPSTPPAQTASDAGAPVGDAGTAVRDAGTTPASDAGTALSDAGVSAAPDAFVLPANCTLDECCKEAASSGEGKGKEPKAGKCGCADPALLRVLTCGVIAPVLVPVGGLL
jgi:hypothetical protein